LIAEPLDFLGVGRAAKTLGKFEFSRSWKAAIRRAVSYQRNT